MSASLLSSEGVPGLLIGELRRWTGCVGLGSGWGRRAKGVGGVAEVQERGLLGGGRNGRVAHGRRFGLCQLPLQAAQPGGGSGREGVRDGEGGRGG